MAGSTLNLFLKEHIKLKDESQKSAREEALKLQGKPLEKNLISSGLLSEKSLTKLKAEYFHIPFLNLDDVTVDEKALELIPSPIIKTYRIVPFSKLGNQVKIALSDPTDLRMLEAVEFLAKKNGWDIQLFLLTEAELTLLMQKIGVGVDVQQALKEFTQSQTTIKQTKEGLELEKGIGPRAPVAKIIDSLISQALTQRASDIHIEPVEQESRVRFRVDGIMRQTFAFPISAHNALVSRIKILANLKIDEQRLPQDGRFRFRWNDEDVDFRISTFPTAYGEKVVMRSLTRADSIPSFNELGLIGQREQVVINAAAKAHGMLLVTGPTGSGKSTTLFVALSQLNKPGVNIVTLEDPVEYLLPGANQGQVNPEIGFTFASGLRSILRQDPNIILVGEIRDKETAELAVHSSLTGHLV